MAFVQDPAATRLHQRHVARSGGSAVMDFTAGTNRLMQFCPSLDVNSVIASARVMNGSTLIELRPGVSVTIVGQTGDVSR